MSCQSIVEGDVMHLMLFEDSYFSNFKPLTYMRPVFELKCGILSFLDRAVRRLSPEKVFLYVRDYLRDVEVFRHSDVIVNSVDALDDDLILINGRLIVDGKFDVLLKFLLRDKDTVLVKSDSVVAAFLSLECVGKIFHDRVGGLIGVKDFLEFKDFLKIACFDDVSMIYNLWDLIDFNHFLLKYDFNLIVDEPGVFGEVDDRAIVYGDKKNLYVGENVVIEGNVNIDVRGGPIYIDRDVEIYGPSSIQGPCYIGRNSRVVSGARIRSDCSIGETCRIGSEVESSIFHGFSNMYHSGFMGHSYIGEWVNIGALTANSDLKNTYGPIKIEVQGRLINTGKIKVGCFIGDHAKTAIGCQIYTGKLIGVCSHLHGIVFENVPSFTIYAKSLGLEPVELDFESAIRTMVRMYERRGRKPSSVELELMKKIFELTSDERIRFGVKRGEFSFRKV